MIVWVCFMIVCVSPKLPRLLSCATRMFELWLVSLAGFRLETTLTLFLGFLNALDTVYGGSANWAGWRR